MKQEEKRVEKEIKCIKVGYIQEKGFHKRETSCTDGGSAFLYTGSPSGMSIGISIPMPTASQVSDEMAMGQSTITAPLRSPFDSLQITITSDRPVSSSAVRPRQVGGLIPDHVLRPDTSWRVRGSTKCMTSNREATTPRGYQ